MPDCSFCQTGETNVEVNKVKQKVRHISSTLSSSKPSFVNVCSVPSYLYNTAEFGSWLALVTMAIETALGGGRRVCLRPRQTEKERSVTVINVLTETETVDSQGPVVSITVLRNMLACNQHAVSQSTRTARSLITII